MKNFTKCFLVILLAFVFLGVGAKAVNAEEYYECFVDVKPGKGASCDPYIGRGHMCQLYQGYDGSGVPDFCSDFCVERSGVPENCANVSVRPSSNPEAHQKFINKLGGFARFSALTSTFKKMTGGVSKWWKDEAKCEKRVDPPQMGQVLEVSGEGKAWISRLLDEYRVVRFAPLLAGDMLVIPEKMSVKVELEGLGEITFKEKSKVLISSGGKKGEQCLRKRVSSGVANGLGRMWLWASQKLQGETFELIHPTAVAGVRG